MSLSSGLVFVENEKVVTDSLTIAEMFGKEHKNVLADIRTQIEYAGEEFGQLNFQPSTYRNKQNKEMPKYVLTEEAFALVVFSYNTREAVQTKIKFIQEFKRMREYIGRGQSLERDPVELALETSLKNYQEIKAIKGDVDYLKDNMRICGSQQHALSSQGKSKVLEVLGGYESPAYNAVARKAFAELWRDFKRHFQIPRYSELAKCQFDEGVYFISKWRPSTSLQIEIEQYNNQLQLNL